MPWAVAYSANAEGRGSSAGSAARIRSAKSFSVKFSIPGTSRACARFYAKALTKKATVGKQAVWFQADSVRGALF